ncbi:hypothetical protein BSKO_08336 [Bryopsis sp. KO-2023]|nr:hypothetical protein BSKO_08336 [Bryopsis sp. KO-2023]
MQRPSRRRQMETWTERPSSRATSVSMLSLPEDVEVNWINSKEHSLKQSRKPGYMRETQSSRAKKRNIHPSARRAAEWKNSLAISSIREKFPSKIPHAPGVQRRISSDSARNDRGPESEFSMTDTAIEPSSIHGGSTPLMGYTNEAVEKWLDGCNSEVHEVYFVVNLTVGQKPESNTPSFEEGEEESIPESDLNRVPETEVVLDGVQESDVRLDGEEESDIGFDGEEESDAELCGVEEPEGGGEASRNEFNEPNSSRHGPFSLGHIFTFLLGIGTMSVLGALK